MTYTIELNVPTQAEAESAGKAISPLTHEVFAHFMDVYPKWEEFYAILENEAHGSQWDSVVGLMRSLQNPQAAISLAQLRHEKNVADGHVTLPMFGRDIGSVYLPTNEERLIPDAHMAISSMRRRLAKHQVGVIQKNGYERHLKDALHAPFIEFEHPENFAAKEYLATQIGKSHSDVRFVLPSVGSESVLYISHKKSSRVAVLRANLVLRQDQIVELQDNAVYGGMDVLVIHSSTSLRVDHLVRQLRSGVSRSGGSVHDFTVPSSSFDVVIDEFDKEIVVDFRDMNPQWYAATLAHASASGFSL